MLGASSRHVLREPVEHRLWAALELHVAVPSGCCALDPLQLLLGYGNVVEHRLDVLGLGEDVVNLIEERGYADALGPLLWDPSFEPNACPQAEKQVAAGLPRLARMVEKHLSSLPKAEPANSPAPAQA